MLVGRLLFAGVALISAAGHAAAQTAPRDIGPPFDRSQTKGTARMSGRVVAADTGKPLHRATVVVSAPDVDRFRLPPDGRRALTTDDGAWEIGDLPAGKYVITVSKAGYVRTQYGQRYARERAKVVELREAATLTRLDILVPKAGVIAGRIGDEAGDPITPAVVSLQQVRYVDGVPALQPVAEGMMSVLIGGLTDDRGEYRIHGLGPGTYYVSAATDTVSTGTPGQTSQLAATYYPGTANVSEAQPVTVGAGEELLNVSFNLTRTRVAKISGVAVASSGEPMTAALRLKNTPALPLGGAETMSDGNGRFTLADVPPGDYRLEVESARVLGAKELTSMPLTVSGDDITDLVITTRPGATASGRVVTDDGSAPPAGVEVFAVPASREAFTPVWMSGRPPPVGEFQIQGLLDTHLIRARVPAGWFLTSVTLDKRSIIDSGYDFKPAATVAGIEVVVSRRATGLSGTVTKDDAPTGDYTVVAFSTDEQRWGPKTRYVQVARPGQNQDFALDGLPSDEYFVIALDYLEPGEETDRAWLDRWKARATRVTVSGDQRSTVTLKVQR